MKIPCNKKCSEFQHTLAAALPFLAGASVGVVALSLLLASSVDTLFDGGDSEISFQRERERRRVIVLMEAI